MFSRNKVTCSELRFRNVELGDCEVPPKTFPQVSVKPLSVDSLKAKSIVDVLAVLG